MRFLKIKNVSKLHGIKRGLVDHLSWLVVHDIKSNHLGS